MPVFIIIPLLLANPERLQITHLSSNVLLSMMTPTMSPTHTSSRLQRLEDKKNKRQALLFILLSVGFLMLILYVGVPLFVKGAVFFGELRSSSQRIDTSDTTPPIPPRLTADYEATDSATVNLNGFSEPGSTVKLILNGEETMDTLTESDGTYTFKQVTLDRGSNTLHAYALDATGNESRPSKNLSIIFDTQAPKLELSTPTEGTEYVDEDREIMVSGTTDLDAYVRVNGYIVVVDNEGNFVKPILLVEGENTIEVIASDEAGNRTVASRKVTYSR